MLDQGNMKRVYIMFMRSVMECGSLVYMGAAKQHLAKFDKIQASAVKLCDFEIESLESRIDAAAIGLCLDLLDGKGYGELQDHASILIEPLKLAKKRTRQNVDAGVQLKPKVKTSSLDSYKSSYLGYIHNIWSRLSQSLVREGLSHQWEQNQKQSKEGFHWKMVTHRNNKTTRPKEEQEKRNILHKVKQRAKCSH